MDIVTTHRFVALGDSTTVGIGDPMPDGTWRGWARMVADSLQTVASTEFHNFAEAGSLSLTLHQRQLPAALEARPTLAAVVVGGNDTLRGSFDVGASGRLLDHTVGALTRAGAIVMTARLPDPGRLLRLPDAFARPLARRIWALNAVLDVIADRHDTVHLDTTAIPETYDRRMWSVDRFHPSERGHRLFANAFLDLLHSRAFPVGARVDPEPSNPPPTFAASAWWLATKGVKWVLDRSADLVPDLTKMAWEQWWSTIIGTDHRIESQLKQDVVRVVDSLSVGPSTSDWPWANKPA